MNFKLENNEAIVKEDSAATYWNILYAAHGQLWLTNFRLIFETSDLFFGGEKSHLLSDIASVNYIPSDRIKITMKNGSSKTFIVKQSEDWAKQISKLLTNGFISEVNQSKDLDIKAEAVKQHIKETVLANKPIENSSIEYASSILPIDTQENQIINIDINPEEIKSQTAVEIVYVPKGVVIKIKRIRTVEHTVNIEWVTTISGKGEIGIKQLVSASIQGEIQRLKGYASQQTESTEYEITLDGEKHNQYKLVWMDVWFKGMAEIQGNNNSYSQPFQFRDRTELKVVPFMDS